MRSVVTPHRRQDMADVRKIVEKTSENKKWASISNTEQRICTDDLPCVLLKKSPESVSAHYELNFHVSDVADYSKQLKFELKQPNY